MASLLHSSIANPTTAQVEMWAPATSEGNSTRAAQAAGLRSWMKDGRLEVRLAAAPGYFVLAASLPSTGV